jgi:hypothetical protein
VERRTRTRTVAVVAALGAISAATLAPSASATGYRHHHPKVKVLASGLSDPFGIDALRHGRFLVAESGAGRVTRVDRRGHKRVVIKGAPGVAGVAGRHGKVFAVLGGPNEEGAPPPGKYRPASVLRSDYSGKHVKAIANLLDYELAHNPDGQVQLVDGKPVDALSNPFSMNYSKYGLLVADGGGNSVLKVNPRTGKVSTFFVPPTVKDVKACLKPGAQANPGTVGCDPVPTGIAVARGSVYVSTLGAEVPGAGRVYRLNPHTGKVRQVWKGLTAPTGIAVAGNGTVFTSHVLEGAPEGDGPPPPGFDPASVGEVTRISPSGRMTHAQVTMPTGLDYRHGHLYASAWSIASFLQIPNAGQIVKVSRRAFR